MPLPSGHIVTADEFAAASNEDKFESFGGCSLGGITSITDITGAVMASFTKYLGATASDLLVEVSVSGFVSVGNTIFQVYASINGVDIAATYMNMSVANQHTTIPTGRARFTGLAAGTYTNLKLRAARFSGTGTCSIDGGDAVSFGVKEDIL